MINKGLKKDEFDTSSKEITVGDDGKIVLD